MGSSRDSILVDHLRVDGIPSHVQLVGGQSFVRQGEFYRVRVALRSLGNRSVTFGVAQAAFPFDIVGVCEEVNFREGVERHFQGEFTAERDEAVNIFLWLGTDAAPIEVVAAQLQPVPSQASLEAHSKEGVPRVAVGHG